MNYQSDWEVKKLGDIASYRKNNALVSKKKYISTENIKQNFEGIEQYKSKELVKGTSFEKNNILIANIRPYLRKIYLAEFCGSCSHDVLALESNEKVYATFLYYCLANDNFIGYVMSNVKGIKMPRGDKKHIMQYSIPLPSISEQKAIAETLETFDAHIKNLSNLIEKKKVIRDGALEDLMSGRTRLKGFSGEWEIVALGSKCEITSSKRVFEYEWEEAGIPFLRTRDIANFHSGSELKDKLFISEETYKKKIAVSGEIKKGDLLVTGVGTIGLPFIIDTDKKIYFKDGNIIWIKKNKNIDTKFLFFMFLSGNIKIQINNACGFTTVGTFTIQNAKKLKIPVVGDRY